MLSDDEMKLVQRLEKQDASQKVKDKTNEAYFEGSKRLAQLGIALPPELKILEVVVNWPRAVVEAIGERSDIKTIRRVGELTADQGLLALFAANNLDTQMVMFNQDKHVFGRAFLSVGVNKSDPEFPMITVESPLEMSVEVDHQERRLSAALKQIVEPATAVRGERRVGALYLPNETIWVEKNAGTWSEVSRNVHNLGRVPVVMCLNRQRTGKWSGRSEMASVIPISDAAARTLTNMQFAIEAAAVPRKYAIGVSEKDFVGPDGQQKTQWESYFSSVWAVVNKDAKIGQMPGADMSGFHDTVDLYGRLAASVTGFPSTYFGHVTGNPPQEGSIRAQEARLVKTVDRSNGESGKALSWAMDIANRISSGEWQSGNRTQIEYHDPGTPTFAQRADALSKMAGGVPIISREGVWDELGWDQARMERERERFEKQDADPAIQALMSKAESLG